MKILILAILPFLLFSQKSIKKELSEFTKIEIDVNAMIKIEFGDTHSVEIRGHKNDLEELTIEVKDGTFILEDEKEEGFFNLFNSNRRQLKVRITLKRLDYLETSGSGELRIEPVKNDKVKIHINGSSNLKTSINSDQFDLKISGSGDATLYDMDCKDVKLNINGSGDLKIDGKTDTFEVTINGSGDISGYQFETNYIKSVIRGSGDIKIRVNEEIDAQIYGSGSIKYKGNPEKVRDKIYGSGDVEKR